MTTDTPTSRHGAPPIVSLLNPLIRRLLRVGMPFGPNVLLTVRGRTSGLPRTFPVAVLRVGNRRYVQSPFGEVNWVRNLRANGDAVITRGRSETRVQAVELSPEDGAPALRDALASFVRSPILRPVIGWYLGARPSSTLQDYADQVRRHPMFELLPRDSGM